MQKEATYKVLDYAPFGMQMPARSFTGTSGYKFGFNGMLKDGKDWTGNNDSHLDFGARIYDSRLGVFLSVDPLSNDNASWSPYLFAVDNPIMFIDVDGEWPGVTFMFTQGEAGVGLMYGLNSIRMEGIAKDEVGKTHFHIVSDLYIVNQNLHEGSSNPQIILGASAGFSVGVMQNWGSETFREATNSKGASIPVGAPSVKGELGVGFELSKDFLSFSLGPQIGFKITSISTSVRWAISLSNSEAKIVNDATDVVLESWIVNNSTDIKDDDGNIIGFSATIATKNTKGEIVNTGIEIYSGTTTNDDGSIQSNGVWESKAYDAEATKAETK